MTRINTIDPSFLMNEHLVAELIELPRIPNNVMSGKAKVVLDKIPPAYTLGKGHVTFFYNKLQFLKLRHQQLRKEYQFRNDKEWMDGNFIEIDLSSLESNIFTNSLCGNWTPDQNAIIENVARIKERFNLRGKSYHFYKTKVNCDDSWNKYYDLLLLRYPFLPQE